MMLYVKEKEENKTKTLNIIDVYILSDAGVRFPNNLSHELGNNTHTHPDYLLTA